MIKQPAPTARGKSRETVVARLLANTRTRKRPNNLVEIAVDIRWLERDLGGLKAVSRMLRLSTDMLRRFLSVENLCPEVRRLVEKREIDIINIPYYISRLDAADQRTIAEEVVAGRLTAEDVRVLTPLVRSASAAPLDKLISRVRESKDIKVYVAHFLVRPTSLAPRAIRSRFEEIVGRDEIVSFEIDEQIGILQITRRGHERLRETARERGLSLRLLVDTILLESNCRGDSVQ